MSAILKKKRISKRNKSAWRKTDIKDVENYLEEKRQEERIGTISDKKDEELFVVDATPNKPKKTGLTIKEKRKLNAEKPLRSLQALKNTSLVPDPIAKRNHVRQKKSGRIIEEEIRNPSKARHFQANKDRERYYEQLDKKINKTRDNDNKKFDKDIWVVEDFRDKIPGLKDEKGWISDDLALYVAKSMGKVSVKVHDGLRHRTTKAKNFQPPHAGISYNPSPEDYNALLRDVVGREEKIIKEEEHLKRVTTKMFSKVTPEERDLCRLKEMKSGLENDEDEIVDTSAAPYDAVNPPVENKKKSKQARRKALLQKELQKRQEAKKTLKKQIADINRIKSLKAEVLNEANELNELRKRRKKTALKKKFEPKRLARLKYKEPDMDVNMPGDICGNLRNIKTESNLLVDRFKNFQKRNILPPSIPTGKQKARKIKRFPRSSHKEPGISFEKLKQMKKRNEL